MMSLHDGIWTPTVVAAAVSAGALIIREALVRRGRRSELREQVAAVTARSRGRLAVEQTQLLIRQVELLWGENSRLKQGEAECEARYRDLERRFRLLERQCDDLRRRLDHFGRGNSVGERP